MALSEFSSTQNKRIIRSKWNAPLLEFLIKSFNKKLLYFGLPSPKAEDINDWIKYIDFVIAFQCRDYPNPSNPNQNDKAVRDLEKILNDLMRKKEIENFNLYDGYIEEVIINGQNNDNLSLQLDQFVTLYNLDFCNEITYPQEIYNEKKEGKEKIYKLDILKRILDIQNNNRSKPFKFVVFLTVKADFWKVEAEDYEEKMKKDSDLSNFQDKISSLDKKEKQIRILKAYVYKTISSMFCVNKFIPEFLPVVRYEGSHGHKLVQFTIIGTYEETVGRGAIPIQNIDNYLNQGFLTPNKRNYGLEFAENKKIKEEIPGIDPPKCFMNTKVYENNWEK